MTDSIPKLANLCRAVLESEHQFLAALSALLDQQRAVSPFDTESAARAERTIAVLSQQRNELNDLHTQCRRGLGRLLSCPESETRIALIEPYLPPHERDELRRQRLEVALLGETCQQAIRQTKTHAAHQAAIAGEILAVITGQSMSPSGYTANGRLATENGHARAPVGRG